MPSSRLDLVRPLLAAPDLPEACRLARTLLGDVLGARSLSEALPSDPGRLNTTPHTAPHLPAHTTPLAKAARQQALANRHWVWLEEGPDTHLAMTVAPEPGSDAPMATLEWRGVAQPDAPTRALLDTVCQVLSLHARHERALQALGQQGAADPRHRGQFLSSVSHEVRTPLNGILGMSEMLLQSPLNHDQRRQVQAVVASGESLLKVLRDILDHGQIEAGRLALCETEFPLPELLARLVQDQEQRAHEKGLRLVMTLEPGLPSTVCADAARLQQMLDTLLGSALRFTERGEVHVQVGASPTAAALESLPAPPSRQGAPGPVRWIDFRVNGTGTGTAAGEHPAPPPTGSTLSLTVAQQLALAMGGRIDVPGMPRRGNCFTLTLPLKVVPAPDPDPATTPIASSALGDEPQRLQPAHAESECEGDPSAPATGVGPLAPSDPRHGMRVLVIDDIAVNQEICSLMLSVLGCLVHTAGSALEGLQRLTQAPFDLVLMDIQMPCMDGVEALRQFREVRQERWSFINPANTPVIAVTANALEGDEQRFLALGFDAYLPKPFRLQQLSDLVAGFAIGAHAQGRAHPSPTPQPEAGPSAQGAPTGGPGLSPPPEAWREVFDAGAVARLVELDPLGHNQLIGRVGRLFGTSVDKYLAQLSHTWQAGDLQAVRDIAHTLKSSSANVGALKLSQCCVDIERVVKEQRGDELASLITALQTQGQRVLAALPGLIEAHT